MSDAPSLVDMQNGGPASLKRNASAETPQRRFAIHQFFSGRKE